MLRLGRENPFCHKTPGPRIRDLVLNVTKVQNWPKKVATLVILREKLFVFTKLVIFCGWERSQPFNTCQTLQKLPQIGQKIENMPKTQIGVGKLRFSCNFEIVWQTGYLFGPDRYLLYIYCIYCRRRWNNISNPSLLLKDPCLSVSSSRHCLYSRDFVVSGHFLH